MSVDTDPATDVADAADVDCSLCDSPVGGTDGVVLQCYPAADDEHPGVAAADGVVGVCGDCRPEVDDLLAAWTETDDPPVAADHSIGAGYDRVAEDCSFCDRPLDAVALGVEYYPASGDGTAADAALNYALCAGCDPVFDRFLEQVRAHATA